VADLVSKGDVIAFRLGAHGLTERLDEDALLDAAGRCGIQNSPPGSALLALHARVRNLTRERVDGAVAEEKSLLQTWSMRGAPFYFPTADAPVFTTGVLPPSEEAMRRFLPGVVRALDTLDLSLTEAADLTGSEIHDVLAVGSAQDVAAGRGRAGGAVTRRVVGQRRVRRLLTVRRSRHNRRDGAPLLSRRRPGLPLATRPAPS
jgi:hypothetical protein